jgi:hypothetical protein
MFDQLLKLGSFKWGGRWSTESWEMDCFGMVLYARSILCPGEPLLPNYDWCYKEFTRETFPATLIASLLKSADQASIVQFPSPGDLALLRGANGFALGTYVGDYGAIDSGVLLFDLDGKPVVEPDYRLPNLVNYWRVE